MEFGHGASIDPAFEHEDIGPQFVKLFRSLFRGCSQYEFTRFHVNGQDFVGMFRQQIFLNLGQETIRAAIEFAAGYIRFFS